jgi:hypothetical protein
MHGSWRVPDASGRPVLSVIGPLLPVVASGCCVMVVMGPLLPVESNGCCTIFVIGPLLPIESSGCVTCRTAPYVSARRTAPYRQLPRRTLFS